MSLHQRLFETWGKVSCRQKLQSKQVPESLLTQSQTYKKQGWGNQRPNLNVKSIQFLHVHQSPTNKKNKRGYI